MSFKTVYICHFFASDPEKSKGLVREICKTIVELSLCNSNTKCLPIAPQIYFDNFISEDPDDYGLPEITVLSPGAAREAIMDMCLELIDRCDEVWVYGPTVSSGMIDEIIYSGMTGKKVVCRSDIIRDEVKKLYESSVRLYESRGGIKKTEP